MSEPVRLGPPTPRWNVEIAYQVVVRASNAREAVTIARVLIADGRANDRRITCEQQWEDDPPL